jgi:O-antigen ligase
VLPVIAAIWLIALTAGPGAAPRLRLTRVHVALGAFLACAFLSVVLDAHYLNQTGELMLTFKKLPLLISYISIFVIVASSVRRSEVPALMTFTLVLSVLCALGVIYEYRFKTNVFLSWSDALLPRPFELVTDGNGMAVDSLGRRWVAGPTAYGVELVMMLSMSMAIAVVGIVSTKARRRRLLYALAIAVLFAAMFATQRKSALLAPVAVLLTLAYFRRKELLSLAPLGLVLAVAIAAISPGAVHGVVSQFVRSDASHVATVSDRTSDYDAVRPDLWTHLALGRGYGSYNHDTYRILDSEILTRTLETGVLGLVAFLLIPISVVLAARKTVAARDPRWAPPALCGVAAAVCFIVVSTLFDVTAVPHGTCTFLYLAGLAAVVAGPGEALEEALHLERDHEGRTHRTRAQLPRGAFRERAGRGV